MQDPVGFPRSPTSRPRRRGKPADESAKLADSDGSDSADAAWDPNEDESADDDAADEGEAEDEDDLEPAPKKKRAATGGSRGRDSSAAVKPASARGGRGRGRGSGSSTSPAGRGSRASGSSSRKQGTVTSTAEPEAGETAWAFLMRAGDASAREWKPGSVAARGLPQGAIARGEDGFEIRSVAGVLPLPSHVSVAAAMRKISTGEERAAAGLLRHPNPASVRAFCRLWHEQWGLPAPPMLDGGDPLCAAGAARVAEAVTAAAGGLRRAALPGPVLVVSAGEDADGAEIASRRHLVGREFSTGRALQAAAGGSE
eukprot:scaffold7114_cov62-Isochrysis_galbana.AAC.1